MQMRLVMPPVAEPVTLEVARAHLRVDHSDEDTLIAAYLTAAREQVEQATGRALVTQTWEVQQDVACPVRPLVLPRPPVIEILSVTSVAPDGAEVAMTTADYRVSSGLLSPATSWPVGSVRVQYRSGYGPPDAVPRALVAAILLGLGELYESREASTAKALTENPAFRRLTNLYRIVWP